MIGTATGTQQAQRSDPPPAGLHTDAVAAGVADLGERPARVVVEVDAMPGPVGDRPQRQRRAR